jgi:hypothetical protein
MEQLFAGLAAEGTTEAKGVGFTLESAKAREKLQEFALAQPENYQLLAIAGLYALGCRQFSLTIDADDFQVWGDLSLSREPFGDLWSFVSRGSGDSLVIGCRLLAMAILTSVRLDEMVWRLQSSDSGGSWEHLATVRRGLLTEVPPRDCAATSAGVTMWAKRKAFGQVARRFLTRWWGSRSKREGADEQLIRERLFLPRGSSLVCNGKPLLDHDLSGHRVLAVLETGNAPTLVECPTVHRFERDYSLAVLLCHPQSVSDTSLPGRSNHTQWIWNGLRMDATTLGSELEHVRAFVWAPELRPDLSFTSLVDNRDKQALERTVRSMARELLDRFVRALSSEMLAQQVPQLGPFRERLAMIKSIIAVRIDTSKDWRRLASLNRALVDCPLFLGSGPDGETRWVTMAAIQTELLAGRAVAAFAGTQSERHQVPPWPDRPLVLYTDEHDWKFLNARFSRFQIETGKSVLAQVHRLGAGLVQRPKEGPIRPALSGTAMEGANALSWTLSKEALEGANGNPGCLLVFRPDGKGFEDTSLGLPDELVATVTADWAPSFQGRLLDRELAERVRQALLGSFCQAVAALDGKSSSSTPAPAKYHLAGLLLRAIGENPVRVGWDLPWLTVTSTSGERRAMSPNALVNELKRHDAPVYVASWSEPPPPKIAPEWDCLPIVIIPARAQPGLEAMLETKVLPAEAFRLLANRPPPEWPNTVMAWTEVLTGAEAAAVSPSLLSLTLGVASSRQGSHRGTRVQTFLRSRFLNQTMSDRLYPFLWLRVDWSDGWPDSKAEQRLNGFSEAESMGFLKAACLMLGGRFLTQAAPMQICQAYPATVGSMMFDLLSEPSTQHLPVLLLASGRRVCLASVPSVNGQVVYFTASPDGRLDKLPPDAVYLPGPMEEAIDMLSELKWKRIAGRSRDSQQAEPASAPSLSLGSSSLTAMAAPYIVPVQPAPGHSAQDKPHQSPGQPARPWRTLPSRPEPSPILLINSPQPVEATAAIDFARPETPAAKLEEPVLVPAAAPEPKPPVETPSLPDSSEPGEPGSLLAEDLSSMPMGEDRQQFGQFLRRVTLDQSRPRALSWQDERAVLGQPASKALKTRLGRALLLSALFSIYNRQRAEVSDRDEREFHGALLRWAADTNPNF